MHGRGYIAYEYGCYSAIPASWRAKRVDRDGPHFHVTLVYYIIVVFTVDPSFLFDLLLNNMLVS